MKHFNRAWTLEEFLAQDSKLFSFDMDWLPEYEMEKGREYWVGIVTDTYNYLQLPRRSN